MADQLAIIARLHGVRRVLGEEQAVRVADRADAGKVRRQTGVVHRHDGAGALSDLLLDLIRVDEAGVRVDVGKDGRRADVQDGVRRGGEGQRRGDHLVAGADALREQRQMQRCRAGIDSDAVLRTDVRREVLLELDGARALRPPAGADSRRVGLHLRFRDIRQTERHPRIPDHKIAHMLPPAPRAEHAFSLL